ncbi:MAG: M15 family metallopeptidase [Dysosmobacter sp.]
MYGCVFEKDRVSGDEIHTISADGTPPQAPRTAASCFAGTDAVFGRVFAGGGPGCGGRTGGTAGGADGGGTSAFPASTAEAQPLESAASSQEDAWQLRLVSAAHPLPEDFEVPELTKLRGGHAIDSRAYPALQQMMDDCRAAGLNPVICSSYRTYDKQEELFRKKVNTLLKQGYSQEEAETEAARWVARPGTSEHETGLAVDIVDKSYQLLDEKQAETPVQQWLMAHCAEYGFILRYPVEKSDLTGIGYEPWHYRYVGVEAAKEISERGICLEEYWMEQG